MKTRCYCVGCKSHPLHDKRDKFKKWVTGWNVSDFVWDGREQGIDVECLAPQSPAFSDLDINPIDHEFPVTAYNDIAKTGFESEDFSYIINAWCDNEDHED